LKDLEVEDPSGLDVDNVEDVRWSISSMVSAAFDPSDSCLPHFLAILRSELPGECDDSRDNQYLSGISCRRGERGQPQV
jgi:hypothetical protein